MAQLKKLPIGIQTFEKIRNDNYLYVDKTALIKKLIDGGSY
ncbi:MAG: AAA family ATPase, partial [Desulfuromonadaceae bacterium]|nr:AAA family ATPase [Desulfuromonadaceae bacterium]